MKVMKVLWAGLSAAAASGVEVMILFDASYSGILQDAVNIHLTEAWGKLREAFPDGRFAVASFIDKPAPFVGLGVFGGFPHGRRVDWCYRLQSTLSDDDDISKSALQNIAQGSGLDPNEGHFEAIVRAAVDPKVGWSSDSKKIIMVFTDDFGHSGEFNSLASHVDLFNYPVRCDPDKKTTTGGFGALSTFSEIAGWVTDDWDEGVQYARYYEMANLLRAHMCDEAELSSDELARLGQLRELLGPIEVPKVKPFNIEIMQNDPETHCREHEYPAYSDVVNVLKMHNFELVVVQVDKAVQRASVEDIWRWTLSNPLSEIPNQYRHIRVSSPEILSAAVLGAVEGL